MPDNEASNDILERLRHPEREAERRRPDRLFMLRNLLNVIFIIMAAVAMVGIAISWGTATSPMWCYVFGLVAVVIKMMEVMLRMPGLLKRTAKQGTRRTAPPAQSPGSAAAPSDTDTHK